MFFKITNYALRFLSVTFGYILFGCGGLLLAFIFLPTLKLIFFHSKSKVKNIMRKAVHFCWGSFIGYTRFFQILEIEITHPEIIESAYGMVVVANHPSLLDVVVLISLLPQSNCIVKDALKNNPFMGEVVKATYIFNSADPQELLINCSKSLQAGDNLVIFPEGTRSLPGQKSKLSRGAAQIALQAQANILPIHIECNPLAFLKGGKWYNIPQQKVVFRLEVKPIIKINKYLNDSLERQVVARQITEEIKQVLNLK